MALITQAQWETIIGPDEVVSLCALHAGDSSADSSRVAEALAQGTDHVQEAAVAAGATITSPTAKQRRWVAIASAYFAADAKPQYRTRQEVNPWTSQMANVNAELEAWAGRQRAVSTDTDYAEPQIFCDTARGWDDPSTET